MKRRQFSPEFKDEAVRLVEEQGVSATQAAADLGIGLSTMQKWLRAHRDRKDANVEVVTEADMAELKRLRKENHRLRMECDILKKRRRSLPRRISEIRVYKATQQPKLSGTISV